MRKYGAKRDSNEDAIIATLRAAGCSVVQVNMRDVPDLIVGYTDIETGQRCNILLEVKSDRGKLSDGQQAFHDDWQGAICVVRCVEDALNAVGR